ncbi:MAG: helix-turn-helix transcriptional regulator [Lachnospiraceae bacterium]|jgi:transcriptional regulator with XRE-family HTH domain|nr:helix-turn-helix transcriptional regulator [Lachnospiraceae bacterium]
MKLGDILKELLCLHDMTQKQLAEVLDLSPSALGNYIQGSREPDYGTLIRIADYFHVTTDFLLNHTQRTNASHEEELLIHIFRSLTSEQREFYLEQGQIFIRQNRKKGSSSFSPALRKDKGVS